METIWKYKLEVMDRQTKEIPSGAKLLTVQVQNGSPCLWAIVDPQRNIERRELITHGTGHQVIKEAGRYLGSYQLYDGEALFHVFEGPCISCPCPKCRPTC